MLCRALSGAVLLSAAASAHRIGLLWPEHCSGDRKVVCDYMTKAAEVAVKDFVASGASWTPELIHAPDRMYQDASHDTFDSFCRMLPDGVSTIVGPITSQEALLVGRLSGWHHLPMISPVADADELADRTAFPFFRRTVPGVRAQGDALAEYLLRLNWTEMGILYEKGSVHAASLMHSASDAFTGYGGRIQYIGAAVAGLNATGYAEQLAYIRENHVQAIMVLGSSRFVADLIEAALDPTNPPPIFSGRVWIAGEGVEDPLTGIEYLWDQSSEWGCNGTSTVGHYCQCKACQEHLARARGLLSVGLPIDVWNEHVAALTRGLGKAESERSHLDIYERTSYDATLLALRALDATGAWRTPYSSTHCAQPDHPWTHGQEVIDWIDAHPFTGASGYINTSEMDTKFAFDLVNLQYEPVSGYHHWYTTGKFFPRSEWPGASTSSSSSSHSRDAQELASSSTTTTTTAATTTTDHPLKVAVTDGTAIGLKYCADCRVFDWPGSGQPPDHALLLQGMTLHVLAVEDHPYFYLNKTVEAECEAMSPPPDVGCYSGILWTVLLDLRDRFHFDFDVHVQHGQLHSAEQKLAAAHGQYDILLANLPITEARQKVIDFTQPLFETESVVVVRMPEPADPDMFRFLEPFSGYMWLTVVGIIVVNAAVFYWLENGVSDGIADGWAGCEDSFFWSFTAFLFTAPFMPATRGGRLLSLGFFFIALVALSAYTAELTVYLLREDVVYQFGNFGNFLPGSGGAKAMSQMLVSSGSLEHDWLCRTCQCCDGGEGPQLLTYDAASDVTAHEQIMPRMQEQCDPGHLLCPLGAVTEKHLANFIIGQDCGLTIHPFAGQGIDGQGAVPTLDRFGLGLALKKDSPYSRLLSEEVARLKETHTIDRLQEVWFSSTCPTVADRTPSAQTDIENFAGIYVIFAAFCALTALYKGSFIVWAKYFGDNEDVDGDGRADDMIVAERRRQSIGSPLSGLMGSSALVARPGTATAKSGLAGGPDGGPGILHRMIQFLEDHGANAPGSPHSAMKFSTDRRFSADCVSSEGGQDDAEKDKS